MDSKRKHSASCDHDRKNSKKSNIDTENLGTSSAHCADNQRASMSAIDLNMANLQEQVSGLPSAFFDNNAESQDVIDLTLTTSSSESDGPYVISSDSEQDYSNSSQNDEAMANSSSTITINSNVSDNHLDDEFQTLENIDTPNHQNSLQHIDDAFNTFKTYSYKGEHIGCYCVDLNKDCSDNGVQTANNIDATERTNALKCGDDEINAITSEWSTVFTLIGKQDNDQTQNMMNDTSSKSSTRTPRGSTLMTSIREQDNGCFVYLTEYDEAMIEIRSKTYTIEKQNTPSLKKPISSFVVMSSGQNLNVYNGEGTQTSFVSSKHNKDPPVIVYSLIRDIVHPNVSFGDDEIHPKKFTKL